MAQPLGELVAHQRPHEVQLLAGALVGEPLLTEVVAVLEDAGPHVVDAVVLEGRAGHHGRRPLPLAAHQAQGAGQLARRRARLTLARTGDQLQGIKKGILEIADVIAVNKADGDRQGEARSAARELSGALRMVRGKGEWAPPVVTCSALEDAGVGDVWARVLEHREHLGERGLADKRAGQQLDFMWALVRDELAERLRHSPGVAAIREQVRDAVLAGDLPATTAADRIIGAYDADR